MRKQLEPKGYRIFVEAVTQLPKVDGQRQKIVVVDLLVEHDGKRHCCGWLQNDCPASGFDRPEKQRTKRISVLRSGCRMFDANYGDSCFR